MFETIGSTGALMPAVDAADVFANSLSKAVYGLMPSDTDLSEFTHAGYRGLNFAFIGGESNYHAATDDLAHSDHSVRQQLGTAVLAATRQLATADLREQGEESVSYFNLRSWLVRYPMWVATPLAAVAVLGYGLLVWWVRGRSVRLSRVAASAGMLAFPVTAAMLSGWLVSLALGAVQTDWLNVWFNPDYKQWFDVGLICVAVVMIVLWYTRRRHVCSATEIALAALGWLAALTALTSLALPGASYLFVWPTLVGVLVIAASVRWTRENSNWRFVVGVGPGTVMLALSLPIMVMLVPAFDVGLAAAPLLFLAAIAAAAVAPVLEGVARSPK
jgi:hypothetical protein